MAILLPIIAVMFTFSFNTAFAAIDETKVVETREAAVKMITDKYNESLAKITLELANAKAGTKNPTTATAADWNAACEAAFEEVKAVLDIKLAEAYQKLGEEEQKVDEILGYEFGPDTSTTGYVNIAAMIDKVDISKENLNNTYWDDATDKFKDINAEKPAYKAALANAIAAIKGYDLEQFAKDDKVTFNGETKSSYEWAVAKQSDALAYLGALKDSGEVTIGGSQVQCNLVTVKTIYEIKNAGTMGETRTGRFFTGAVVAGVTKTLPNMDVLKTTAVITTDNAKIEYAKSKAISVVKSAIETQRAAELEVQNQIIFSQSVSSKPNQAKIDAANKEIKAINEKYDAMVKVWEYRLTNAEYKVEKAGKNEMVNAYFDGALYNSKINTGNDAIAFFNNNAYSAYGIYVDGVTISELNGILNADGSVAIIKLVADLEEEAADLKASIAVDGTTYIDVDAALKEAVEKAYMTGSASLDKNLSDSAVHMNAHKLLGTNCAGASNSNKVTLEGKSYDNLSQWKTDNYSPNNKKAVKAIIKDAKSAVKAAKTIADANKAFLEAYAKYDAVLTKADQAALFSYTGALYQKDTAAKAELNAYIDYKVSLMSDAPDTQTAKAVKEYFNILASTDLVSSGDKEDFLEEVVDEASLNAAIAKVKETVDSLKTKVQLKEEGAALAKEASAIKRAVTLEQKEAVLALYDKFVEYAKYCDMVNYTNPAAAAQALVGSDIAHLENLELAKLKDAKDELGKVSDLTLAKEDAVKAFADAQSAYNDLYAPGSDYAAVAGNPAKYTEAGAYEDKIFALKVKAAEALIKALPLNASAAKVAAAQKAVDALGFDGICAIDDDYLTKLNRFDYDASYAVKSMKLRAYSKYAKKGITVKWVIEDGRKSDAKGYQVWRSTKANTGYKKLITVNPSYGVVNAKNLKKGVTYYYKVRAYNRTEDGKLIFSDWSNKAYRKAK